ncbi:MAG TPA: chromosome partitioning protein ParA [Porphyromonadaceae bacterium]|mgnify:FL=1|nr:chromosome partitioning protein ParA [Porphyromonadaceae bacterium]
MALSQNNNVKQKQPEDFIRIQDLFYLCLAKWRWFVLSLFVTLGIAVLYLLTTPAVYTRSASLLIKEDSKGKSMAGDVSSLFSDLGLSQANVNVNNELIAIQSPAVILETIKRLHIDVDYQINGPFHRKTLYGSELPVRVVFTDLTDKENAKLTLRVSEDSTVVLSDFVWGDGSKSSKTIDTRLGTIVDTPLGKLSVMPTSHYTNETSPLIYVSRTNLYSATNACKEALTISLSDEKVTVIDLSYNDVSTQRAEDVINTLIAVYKENWIKDKNQITVSTSMFINDRLKVIATELGDVDEDISSFKSKNLLPDVEAASGMYMEQSRETSNLLLSLKSQLSMANYIRNYLTGPAYTNQLLPANSGIENSGIESQISEYNTLQLQRNNLLANSSEQNPLIKDLDQSLESMRKAIVSSIDNLVVTLNTQTANLQKSEQQTTAQIAANPDQAKYLLSIGREQKVKEALYLFLLQKREENELSQAFTAYNTRLLTPPTGKITPTAPVKKNILLVAFVFGLLIPIVIIFIRENTNTTVRGRKDLENSTLPFLGEIPLYQPQKRNRLFWKKQPEIEAIVVEEGSRDVINEAFRVVRTNLEFMDGSGEPDSNVLMLTSFNPGSGKTFLTMNMAISLAIKGKSVLVIDGDLRRGSISDYVDTPKIGLSDYLGKRIDTPEEIIVVDKKHPTLHILPVGTIPPNPTELLVEERLKELINRMRSRYDYILIDCPPIDVVADTAIIEKLADRTIFVVRAGLLERSMLVELEKIYNEQKYKNMCVILNGTTGNGGRYGYGYRYGYKYGYHYGSEKKKTWWGNKG